METLRYPIGKFVPPTNFSSSMIQSYIQTMRIFPEELEKEILPINETILNTPYRPDGWTVRQVVHHCADSHMNCLVRFKLALTEDNPTIKPYIENKWATLPDSQLPVNCSLDMLRGIHTKIIAIWESLTEADLQRKYIHPEHGKEFTLAEAMALYDWHSRHHLEHIRLVTNT